MTELRFAIVGAGGMGFSHASQVAGRQDARVTAVCDTSQAAVASFVERLTGAHGEGAEEVSRHDSLEAMLETQEFDAAVVTTPHTLHAGQVRACLARGLHVLVEKPMTTTAADARDLMELSEREQRVLAIAYQRHGEGQFIKVRELLQDGAIGEIQMVTSMIAQDALSIFARGASWRADPELSGGGHFMDTGSHINDILLWTTDLEPVRVQAFINQRDTDVDVLTAVNCEFTNGAVGSMAYTSLSPEWREEFRYYGTEGMIRFGREEPLLLHRRGEDIVLPGAAAGGQAPLGNFVDAIHGDAAVQAPPICGLRVAQLSEAAYASVRSGRPERVG